MSKNFRVISFDFRGHGFNTIQPENDLSIETLISETEKVLLEINRLFPDETGYQSKQDNGKHNKKG